MRIILILFLIFNISFTKCMENNPQEKYDPSNVESPRVFVELNGTYKCNYDKIENDSLEEVNPFHLKDPAINYYHAFSELNGTNRFNFYRVCNILLNRDDEAFHNDVLYKYYPKEIVKAYYQYRLSTYKEIIMEDFTENDYFTGDIENDIRYLRLWIIRYWLGRPPIYLNKEDFLSIIYTAEQKKYRFLFPYLPLQELIFLNFIRLKPQEKINNYETIKLPNQSGFTVSQNDIYNVWDDVRHIQKPLFSSIILPASRKDFQKGLIADEKKAEKMNDLDMRDKIYNASITLLMWSRRKARRKSREIYKNLSSNYPATETIFKIRLDEKIKCNQKQKNRDQLSRIMYNYCEEVCCYGRLPSE